MSTDEHDLRLQGYISELESDPEFVAEGIATEFIEEVLRVIHERGLSQSWLASKLGVSRAHVSRILKAPPNMTLLTMVRISQALEGRLNVSLDAARSQTRSGGSRRPSLPVVAERQRGRYRTRP